jgi:hypothetical protein
MAMDKALTGWIVAIAPKMVPAATAQYMLTFLMQQGVLSAFFSASL